MNHQSVSQAVPKWLVNVAIHVSNGVMSTTKKGQYHVINPASGQVMFIGVTGNVHLQSSKTATESPLFIKESQRPLKLRLESKLDFGLRDCASVFSQHGLNYV